MTSISVSIGLTGLISGVVSRDSNGSIDIQAGTISYDGSEIKQTFAFGQNSWNGFEFGKCEESDISRTGFENFKHFLGSKFSEISRALLRHKGSTDQNQSVSRSLRDTEI